MFLKRILPKFIFLKIDLIKDLIEIGRQGLSKVYRMSYDLKKTHSHGT